MSFILEELLENRNEPVLVMKAVTDSLHGKRRISLTILSRAKQRVLLSGKAYDFAAVVDFVTHLNTSALFKSVELHQWKTRESILSFELHCVLKD